MSVAIIDTSIFCELLGVPGKSNDPSAFRFEMKAKIAAKEILFAADDDDHRGWQPHRSVLAERSDSPP